MAERKYKYFKVSEVFGPAKLGKYHNPKDLVFDNNGYYYICASNKNNGVNQKMPRVNGKNLYLTPQKIVSWGKQCPKFTYHDEPCVTGQGMYYLDMTNYNEETALYLCAVLAGACKDKYNYSNCLIGSVMNDITIPLPLTATSSIDWDFMTDYIRELEQERIRELEQERIRELDAYLKAAGLDSYELNAEDKRVLALYREALEHKDEPEKCELQFGEFLLPNIAELYTGNKFDKNKMKHSSPSVNFVSRTANNNGVSDFVDVVSGVDPYPAGCITLAFGGSIGSCFLQEQPFYTGQNVGVIKFGDDISNKSKLYFATVLRHKCQSSFTAFSDEINKHFKTDLSVDLPIDDQGMPDWIFMEKYIKAIEKVSIANVVKYKNKVIAATKQVVNGNSVSYAAAA